MKNLSVKHLFWKAISYQPKLFAVDTVFWIGILVLPAVTGLLLRHFFNSLTTKNPFWLIIALLLALETARIVFLFLGRFTKTQYRFAIASLIRRNLLEKILYNKNPHQLSPGAIISYFRDDVTQIEDNIAFISEIIGTSLFAFISLIILLQINWQITLFVFLPLILILALVEQAQERLKVYRRESRRATEQVTGAIGEIFNSVQAIKLAGASTTIVNHFQQVCDRRREKMLRDRFFNALLESIFQNIVSLGTGGILLLSAILINSGVANLSIGDFAIFIYYLGFITDFLGFLGIFLTLSAQTEVSLKRMANLVNEKSNNNLLAHRPLYLPSLWGYRPQLPTIPQPISTDNDCLQSLRVVNLTYLHPETNKGIKNINFELQKGTLTVITGKIGSGKTTLLRTLLGLLPKQSGEIYWNNRLIHDPALFFLPPRSAYTPQSPQLFSNTLRENILLGLEKDDNAILEALSVAALTPDLANMTEGLETLVGSKGMRLSGGQLQRTAIARTLIRQPELIILDDVSSALDVETAKKLWQKLLNDKKYTILVVSHNSWLLEQGDRVIICD